MDNDNNLQGPSCAYDPAGTECLFVYKAISIVSELEPIGLEELYPAPTNAVHVKMQIANCNIPSASISMTNATEMQNVSLYAGTPNPDLGDNLYGYDAIDNSSSFPMLECKPTITSFSPQQINAGVEDILTIRGYLFGPIKGSGGVSMKNNNDGGLTDVMIDDIDYVAWSDTMIQVKVPSETDTSHNGLNKRAGVGTGRIKVKTNVGDIAVSNSDVVVGYAATNSIATFTGTPKKYLNLLRNNGLTNSGGFIFHIDSSIYNRADMKGAVAKAIHDWVCLTTVNFQMGPDTILPRINSSDDRINLIHFGFDDSVGIAARTGQWLGQCEISDKVTVRGIDISFNPMYYSSFFVDTTGLLAVPTGKVDFYNTILHELGHGHSLSHVNNANSVMLWTTTPGPVAATQRAIRLYNDATCYEGGSYVIGNSAISLSGSCYSAMTPLFTNQCILFNSIKKPNTINSLKLYPNPTEEYLNVEYYTTDKSTIEIIAYALTGNLVHSFTLVNEEAGEHVITFSTFDWTDGFYLVNVKINGQNNVVKIIKD